MDVTSSVKEYYGETLSGSEDLKTNACCTDASLPDHVKAALANVHDEVLSRYYGCGLIAPEQLKGCRILDLGSGSGRDAYVLAQLVGEEGEIVGVDMTPAQLEISRKYEEWHRERFGYEKSNVRFIEGELENLENLGLEPGSFDVLVSNCVINLCKDKEAVMRAAKSLLKEGGEIYFADVYADRRVPADLREDEVLYGECLSGALYINDFHDLVKEIGFTDPRIVSSRRLTIDNEEIEKLVGDIRFYSVTYRLFNVSNLDNHEENYGQSATYKGTISEIPNQFILDDLNQFNKGKVTSLSGNSVKMIQASRFSDHFDIEGDFSEHKGLFCERGVKLPHEYCAENVASGGCCDTGSDDSCCDTSSSSDCCSPVESSCCDTSSSSDCCSPAETCCDSEVDLSAPGMVQTSNLKELWFHTGTNCNLSCTGCLEGSAPGDKRIDHITFDEAKKFIDEALTQGVEQFSFTGGEPFVNPEMTAILKYALQHRPCLVLTNATSPLQNRFDEICTLKNEPHQLSFRVSLDHSDPKRHDAIRGEGRFVQALQGLKMLEEAGFHCSIARHSDENESVGTTENEYRAILDEHGIDSDKRFVAFPDFLTPNSHPDGIPTITMNCLKHFNGTTGFMCETSRMVVKKGGTAGVYACTLVDDDDSYRLGETIEESLNRDVHLTHHRCFSCYKSGASCSEL